VNGASGDDDDTFDNNEGDTVYDALMRKETEDAEGCEEGGDGQGEEGGGTGDGQNSEEEGYSDNDGMDIAIGGIPPVDILLQRSNQRSQRTRSFRVDYCRLHSSGPGGTAVPARPAQPVPPSEMSTPIQSPALPPRVLPLPSVLPLKARDGDTERRKADLMAGRQGLGCPKCRYLPRGCKRCRDIAEARVRGRKK